MSQLKPSYIQDIQNSLAGSVFSPQDFEIELPKSGDVQFKLIFKHDENFSYTVKESYGETPLLAVVRPSNFKVEAEWKLKSFTEALSSIPRWCQNIREDLYTLAPNRDPLEGLRKEFESQLDSLIEKPDENFTTEELSSVNQKFDELFKKFELLKDEYEISKKQLSEIRQEFEEFKNSAEAYPKGVWSKVTNNKLVDIIASVIKSKEGREFLLGELKKLIVT